MFALEKTIAAWRHQLRHRRVFLGEDLDELERHLRDHVAASTARGEAPEAAFHAALAALGDAGADEAEYRKVYWGKLRRRGARLREVGVRAAMVRSYAVVAVRHLARHRGYAVVNVTGLAAGLAACLLIALYVRHEFSYERFHARADRIYRVAVDRHYENGDVQPYAAASAPLAPALRAAFPEVERAVRLFNPRWTTGRTLLRAGDRAFYEDHFFYADADVFDVFSFRLLRGDPATALRAPGSVVLSEAMAAKYFGDADPVGRTLVLDDSVSLAVTGVMADLPSNTHLKIDFLAPLALMEAQYGTWVMDLWGFDLLHTYVLLEEGVRPEALAAKLPAFFEREVPDLRARMSYQYAAELQPLASIHLHSNRPREVEPNSDVVYPYALSAVAVIILLIAGINFVNLTTARSVGRAREVGVRKVLGGRRRQLVVQFLGEATLLSVVAAVPAAALALGARPVLGVLSGHAVDVPAGVLGTAVAALFGLALLVGLAAGSFPAFRLAALEPVRTLKGTGGRASGHGMRRGLVAVQFVLSIALIAATAVVYEQLAYTQQKRLGFDREHVVVLRTGPPGLRLDALKQALLEHPGVAHVAASSGVPGREVELVRVRSEGAEGRVPVQMLWVDPGFVRTLGIELADGRDFSAAFEGEGSLDDSTGTFLVNEAAARAFGWEAPVGRELAWPKVGGAQRGPVVGVLRDFHTASLHERIEPLVLVVRPTYRYVSVRLRSGDVAEALAFVERAWKAFAPDRPFDYVFLDDAMDHLYASERRLARVFGVFAGLAVVVACLGLFGLAAFSVAQRTKEIGVRKVMGASTAQLAAMLAGEYARLVTAGFVAAVPLSWFAMARWLEGFAYRITLSWPAFVLAGLAALVLALLAVGYQTLRAARAAPVDALRYE